MHNNYYLLRQLTKELEPILIGGLISECFSQNKEELIIRIERTENPFFIKANLQPSFSCLSFPEVFNRAKRNSVDLFPDCIGLVIEGVKQFENERSFALLLNHNYQLLFKMHANRSNIVLFKDEEPVTFFRNNLESDETLNFSSLNRNIDWSEDAFYKNHLQLKQHYFTFGKVVWACLEKEGFFTEDIKKQWQKIISLKQQLENPEFLICRWKDSIILSLIGIGEVLKKETTALKALNTFSHEFLQSQGFTKEKLKAIQNLAQTIQSAENYLLKSKAKLNEVENDSRYMQWGDLLMANLHSIKQGEEEALVTDFYNENRPLKIKLKRELTAQKNAEVFYRKAKNRQIEIDRLKQVIEQKEKEKEKVEHKLLLIQKITDLKELRKVTLEKSSLAQKKEKNTPLPYHEFTHQGFVIWVGRNAQANDVLTLKYSYKEDLWLHAKDVAGSHVLIKHQAGKVFPKDVIERAAELAAYNSKRKTETLAAVSFTSKKFVRKRKGDPAGAVVVEREEVILVEPKL